MRKLWGVLLLWAAAAQAATESDFTGRWEVATPYEGGTYVAGLDLSVDQGAFTGVSSHLIPGYDVWHYAGKLEKDVLTLKIEYKKSGWQIGDLKLTRRGNELKGEAILHNMPVTVVARRPRERPANAPRVHDFVPKVFHRTFSSAVQPVLRIFPGDTVRTETVDTMGVDGKGVTRTFFGNPATGPFYIEGAMQGDTIAVRFNRIRPNRNTAFMYRGSLSPRTVSPGHVQEPAKDWSKFWDLDLEKGIATPKAPSEKLKNFQIKLDPMLGCVSVAPFWGQASSTSDMGDWGGNLDYNGIREGVTVYFSVFYAGGLLFIGDGHAQQGDGEITGQGLETSMDVEFTVDLIRGEALNQPWAENDEYILVSGIGGTATTALQHATSGMTKWLKMKYGLNDSEITTVLAPVIQYDVAAVIGKDSHIVAKIRKSVLAQLPKPGG
jgi:amidase